MRASPARDRAAHTGRMVDAGERPSLPIACTLGASEGADRVRDWQTLLASHRTGRDRREGCLEVRFRDVADVSRELNRLVSAERDCCSFVDWAVASRDGELVLTIKGDDAALSTFSF
jgi:hypothetical protein